MRRNSFSLVALLALAAVLLLADGAAAGKRRFKFRCGIVGKKCCAGARCFGRRVVCDKTFNDCVSCGKEGKPACPGKKPCDKGLINVDGICKKEVPTEGQAPPQTCGVLGEECCEGFTCKTPDLACSSNPFNDDTACVKCGGEDQLCCEGEKCNEEGQECQAVFQDTGKTCTVCGELFKPVCTRPGVAPCEDGLVEDAGTCQEPEEPDCGDLGQTCCQSNDGFKCNSPDLACFLNPFNPDTKCVKCGNAGQQCCDGQKCNKDRLACFDDPRIADEPLTCTPCGEDGQPPCTKEGVPECVDDLVVVGEFCQKPVDSCCPDGKACCSGSCVPVEELPFRSCLAGATCKGNCEGSCGCDKPPKDCCPKGKSCCGDGCIPTEDLPSTTCPVAGKCGCGPKPVKDCCPPGKSCCGDGCIPTDKLPLALCPLPGKCGCDEKPVKDCCPKGKSCCGDGCIPTKDLPFTLCPVAGKCGCKGH